MGGKGNPNIKKHGFKKGDPRINRKGRPKVLPKMEDLMVEILGHADTEGLQQSEIGKIMAVVRKKAMAGDMRAVDILLERGFGRAAQTIKAEIHSDAKPPVIQIVNGAAPNLADDDTTKD